MSTPTPTPSPHLPKSCTQLWINVIGLLSFFLTLFLIRKWGPLDALDAAIISLASLTLPIMLLEFLFLKTYRRPSTGLDFSLKRGFHWPRIITKLQGFYLTLAVIAFVYWVIPEYHKPFYFSYWMFIGRFLPMLLIGSILYFAWMDRYMVEPEDGYWQVGLFFLGEWKQVDRKRLKQYVLGWTVKAFFLPIMFCYFVGSVRFVQSANFSEVLSNPTTLYAFLYEFMFTIDLVYVCVGYLLTLRILDNHIRSTEPTLLGWSVALACYKPFWSFIYENYLQYNNEFFWYHWLSLHPRLFFLWGGTIICLLGIYSFSTVAFGLRFSNLTHRGILTNGPYRLTKHPAYVAKNMVWWMMAVPFIPNEGMISALRYCTMVVVLNGIYFLRARTEERHLSRDAVYVEYALAMNEKSIFRGLGKLFPFFKYQPPSSS